MRLCLVLTTINVPELLLGYADNFERYGHRDEVGFVVIADLKTPPESVGVVEILQQRGFRAEYWDVARQDDWLNRFPDLKSLIPYNSDNRRNVGYLRALELGADVIVSLDDDNFVTEGDYFAGHEPVGRFVELETVSSCDSWYNLCEVLDTEPSRPIFPRGYPYRARTTTGTVTRTIESGRIVLNAGLWLGDPDVDAVSRVNERVRTTGLTQDRLMLAPGTFAPINSQNTAIHRDAIPCYYFLLMGAQIGSEVLDRYGDIWQGFLAKKAIDHLGDRASFGLPLANHRRNWHNLFADLRAEMWGMILTDHLSAAIQAADISGVTYAEAYRSLSKVVESPDWLPDRFPGFAGGYLAELGQAMRAWVDVAEEILSECVSTSARAGTG